MATAPFLFILVGTLCLWICYSARSVHFTVSPGRKGTPFFLHTQLHNHQKDLNPRLWPYYYGKVNIELEKKTHTKNKNKLFMVLVIWPGSTLKFLFAFDFKWCLSNRFLKGSSKKTFVTLNRFCPLSKPPLPHPLFLMDKTKLDGIPSKIKLKIHVFWNIVFQILKVFLIKEYKIS